MRQEQKLNGAVAGIGTAVAGLQNTPVVDSSSVCTNVNGCDDTWDIPIGLRGATANRSLD